MDISFQDMLDLRHEEEARRRHRENQSTVTATFASEAAARAFAEWYEVYSAEKGRLTCQDKVVRFKQPSDIARQWFEESALAFNSGWNACASRTADIAGDAC